MGYVGQESVNSINKIEIARPVSTIISLNQVIVSVFYIHVLHLNATWMIAHPMVSLQITKVILISAIVFFSVVLTVHLVKITDTPILQFNSVFAILTTASKTIWSTVKATAKLTIVM
jgi:hypothetical protein